MRKLLPKKRKGGAIPQLVSHEGTFPGSEYDADEEEFLAAIERYKREAGVRFPSYVECLRVAKKIGWQKVAKVEGTGNDRQPGTSEAHQ